MSSSAEASAGAPAGSQDVTSSDATTELGYTLWAVLRRDPNHPSSSATGIGGLATAAGEVEAAGVTIRGWYDVSSIRADADLMVWMHGPDPQKLQRALRTLRRTPALEALLPTWNALGVHRDAEFTANHLPSFMRGKAPEKWVTVYPFVRSYDWYLLPEEERKAMLAGHGRKGAEFPQVLANTVAAFALGDYEWILALEAPELVDLVDLMRHLRQTEARLHVREEVPFYTGRRMQLDEIPEVLA
jgi:chlorite dismutase